jgi:O-antigen/teichoic acid export membrane protein
MNLISRFLRDDLIRHMTILFSGMFVVHVCNMVFQMAVGRVLPEEEYALLAAFLGILAIVQRPLATLTTGVSHYSSLLVNDGRVGDVKRLLKKWLMLAGIPALILGFLVLLFNEELAGFMHLDRPAPVLIAGVVLPGLFILPVLSGAGHGLQQFGWCSAASILGAGSRLAFGAGFVWFLYPACGWAMLGHGLGIYVSGAVFVVALLVVLRGTAKSVDALPSMRMYLMQTFIIQAGYAVLMTADVVLINHFLPGDADFAYSATLGRLVVFLPGVIVSAMFPKVVSSGTLTAPQRSIFFRSLGYTAFLVAVSCLGCVLFAPLLARILFGIKEPTLYLSRMIGAMSIVMGLSAILNTVVLFLLAQRRFLPAFSVVLFALAYLAGACAFHANSWQIVLGAGICNAGALVVVLLAFFRISLSEDL